MQGLSPHITRETRDLVPFGLTPLPPVSVGTRPTPIVCAGSCPQAWARTLATCPANCRLRSGRLPLCRRMCRAAVLPDAPPGKNAKLPKRQFPEKTGRLKMDFLSQNTTLKNVSRAMYGDDLTLMTVNPHTLRRLPAQKTVSDAVVLPIWRSSLPSVGPCPGESLHPGGGRSHYDCGDRKGRCDGARQSSAQYPVRPRPPASKYICQYG